MMPSGKEFADNSYLLVRNPEELLFGEIHVYANGSAFTVSRGRVAGVSAYTCEMVRGNRATIDARLSLRENGGRAVNAARVFDTEKGYEWPGVLPLRSDDIG
jgi:hypothetical protein